jgi:hypothetical protein
MVVDKLEWEEGKESVSLGTANKLIAMFVTGEDSREVLKMVDGPNRSKRRTVPYSRSCDGRTSSVVLGR